MRLDLVSCFLSEKIERKYMGSYSRREMRPGNNFWSYYRCMDTESGYITLVQDRSRGHMTTDSWLDSIQWSKTGFYFYFVNSNQTRLLPSRLAQKAQAESKSAYPGYKHMMLFPFGIWMNELLAQGEAKSFFPAYKYLMPMHDSSMSQKGHRWIRPV